MARLYIVPSIYQDISNQSQGGVLYRNPDKAC